MRSFFLRDGIILTLLTLVVAAGPAHAHATNATCSPESTGNRDLGWLEDLSRALDASVGKPVVKASPAPAVETKPTNVSTPNVPTPIVTNPIVTNPIGVEQSGDRATKTYDLAEPMLTRLRNSAHASASKCRTSLTSGRTLCGSRQSKYLCYRGVKDALVSAGLVDRWWAEDAASDAHDKGTLEKKGFTNVMDDGYTSENAPLGAVLVYAGGKYRCRGNGHRKTCGHIEIKVNEHEYCSDYCKSIPVDEYIPTRRLIGVYVKE